ncbi:flagellar hook-basal body complex FliE family protein, partial [Vibrio parahaemolyticus AQ3810]
ISSLRPTKTS